MLWAFFHTLQSYICLWNLPWSKNGSKDRSAREWKVENMRMFDLIEIYEIYCFLWWLKHMGSLIKFKGTKSRSRNLKSVKPDTNLPTWILNKHLVKIPSKISQWVSSRCLMVSTNQADPSCFYFRISWLLMERRWFYFFRPLHLLQGLRSNNIK